LQDGNGGSNAASDNAGDDDDQGIDITHYTSSQQLTLLGMDGLKAELVRRGLKAGGSLQERAQRLFAVRGLSPNEIPANLRAGLPKTAKTLNHDEVCASHFASCILTVLFHMTKLFDC
jgi:hypothetical protein